MYYPAQPLSRRCLFYGEGALRIIVRQFTGLMKVYQAAIRRASHSAECALYDKARIPLTVPQTRVAEKQRKRVMAKVQYNFGVWYYNGYHLLKDHKPGAGVVSQSRSVRLAEAQDAIGVMFMQGEGVSGLPTGAGVSQSCSLGLLRWQTHLGIMFAFGRGVAQATDRLSHGIEKQQNRILRKRNIQLGVHIARKRRSK